ncbi:hypothetical protein C8R46DRAFT_1232297 [Mycena filopes]|nr:hypothetical protein C8R46DRAFT_1232297 [Mycena filopes]
MSGSRKPRPSLDDLYLVYPSFEDLYLTYEQLFTHLFAAMCAACEFIAQSRGSYPDRDLEVLRRNFYTADAKAIDSLASAAASWDEIQLRLPKDLARRLQANSELSVWTWLDSVASPWPLTVAGAQCQTLQRLQTALPRFFGAAREHIAALTKLYDMLKDLVQWAVRNSKALAQRSGTREGELVRLFVALQFSFYQRARFLKRYPTLYLSD